MRQPPSELLKRLHAPLLCLCVFAAPAMAAGPSLKIGANLDNLGPGDIVNLAVGAVTGSTSLSGDVYLTLTFPGGALYYVYLDSHRQAAVSPAVHPLAVGIAVPPGTDTGYIPILSYQTNGQEPLGGYVWNLVVTQTGTMNAVAVQTRTTDIWRYSIAGVLGGWSGSWNNTTYATSGALNVTISEAGAGALNANVSLGGSVFGAGTPAPFAATLLLNSGGGSVASPSSGLGNLTGSFGSDGSFTGSFAMVPMSSIGSVTFNASMTGRQLSGTYTINFSGGSNAQGTLGATHQ